jgi:hypothetical protein
MMRNSLRAGVAALTLTAPVAIVPLVQPLLVTPAFAQARPAAPQPSPQSSPWPHVVQGEQGTVTVYPPQATSWEDRSTLIARVAVELQARLARQEGVDAGAAAVSRAALCELFRLATSP